MSGQDLLKFITQEFTSFIDQSSVDRKKDKDKRQENRGVYSSHWFGIVPFAFKTLIKK